MKFKMTDETIIVNGVNLYRIERISDRRTSENT